MGLPDILSECARLAAGGGTGALASVARRKGSLPMSTTAKMLVGADGSRMGTVGGGCLEAEITEEAQRVIASGRPAISEHSLNSELAGDYGLTCGGTAVLFIEPVFRSDVLRAVYSGAAKVAEGREKGLIATATDWSRGPRKLLSTTAGVSGVVDDALLTLLAGHKPDDDVQELSDAAFVESVTGPATLLVFGGGHVGASVAQAAAFAGWRVTVVDDRPEFAAPERFPYAERAVVAEFHDIPTTLWEDGECYVVVATRGHQHDALIVEQLALAPLRYLGMLGSRRKVALTWDLLRARGIPAERLGRIHAPVGLAIGADTPQEIAIAVVAEMIAVRRSGSRRRGGVNVSGTADGMSGEEGDV